MAFKDINLETPQVERQWVRNESLAVSTTSIELAPERTRTMFMVRNNSNADADVLTIHVGSLPAVAGVGIILKRGESFVDSDEGAGYKCFQGAYTIICATANGVAVIIER